LKQACVLLDSDFFVKWSFDSCVSLQISDRPEDDFLSLHMKGMGLDAIHENLVPTLRKEAVAYSTVTKYRG
jgi:hypothetical protein